MRFGIPAVLWAALLVFAWSRQRESERPREKWLVWGFGLALARELFMFVFVSLQILGVVERKTAYFVSVPLEQTLTMAAIVVIAGSFLRYILDDAPAARRYMQVGLVTALLCYLVTFGWWANYSRANPTVRFGQTWTAWLYYGVSAVLILGAMFILYKKRGWLRNVMLVALSFFFFAEVLMLTNLATGEAYTHIICPISHSFYILAIPLLGYIYIREQSLERHQAIDALRESEKRFRDIVEHAQAGYFFINRQGRFQQVNRAWLQMHGYSCADEVIGRHYSITQAEQSADGGQDVVSELLNGEGAPPSETTRTARDGTIRYHTASFNPVVHGGEVVGLEGFLIDRTQQVQAEAEIQRRNEQVAVLRELDHLRSELIANVSHDLRTPLGLIKLSSSSLLATDVEFDENARRHLLNVILDESIRLEKIVDDLLLLSRYESGQVHLQKRLTPAVEMIEQAIGGMSAAIEQRQIVYDVNPRSLTIDLDPNRMQQVLRNLLSNAIKYSPDGGTIRVEAYADGETAFLTVSDEGIGIPIEELDRIFERFQRVENSTTRRVRGAGLGLAVCRNLVQLHGGEIWATSVPGEGSTFFVALPHDLAAAKPIFEQLVAT